MAAALPALEDHPDLRFAEERRRADRNRAFSGELEAEFIAGRLLGERTLIRAGSLLAVLVAIWRLLVQWRSDAADGLLLAQLCAVAAVSVTLAWLAFSAAFERHYVPWAQVVVPLRNTLGALHFASAVALGGIELLMLMPLLVAIGPFFFSGLRFRIALVSGVMALAAFAISAFVHLPPALALRCCVFLAVCLAGCAIGSWQHEKRARTSFLEQHLIAEHAQRDALTGTRNRRSFDEHCERIWREAVEARRAMALILVDVDHFKPYNDRYGHLAGDDALRRVARALQGFVRRRGDLLARYGGEEFVAILQGVDGSQARQVAEKMRRAVMALGIEHRGSRAADRVTISVGVAAIRPGPARSCRGALQLADQALYRAKLSGRNRVELMDEGEYRLLTTGVFRAVPAHTMRPEDALAPRADAADAPWRNAG